MWNHDRYRNYCLQQFERASRGKFNAIIGMDLFTLAERELERDWSLHSYLKSIAGPHNIVYRLAEDIRTRGQIEDVAGSL